ncbi:hypothetical protein GE061_003546 [Apolygus lucorum]|uniref:Uncharacterized protein n=1 Tax=Apolygus lucorum TaxID=248454 RepID=A0A8S9X498_APOLU|nr:hypothetical protein GE061_003546 [Apolygus lucorum]
MIISSASAAMPLVGAKRFHLSWWSPRLEGLKRDSIRLRCRCRRRGVRLTDTERTEQTEAKTKYRRAVRAARRTDWRNFVTEKGVGDPFGLPYRLVSGGGANFQLATLNQGTALTWDEAAGELLESLFPADSTDNETTDQLLTREDMNRLDTIGIPPPSPTNGELEGIIKSSTMTDYVTRMQIY